MSDTPDRLEEPNDPPPTPRDALTEELVAYLDGELDSKAAAEMATKISLNPKLRAEAESLKKAWDALDILPKPQPSANFMTKTVSQVMPVPAMTATATAAAPKPITTPAMQPVVTPKRQWGWLLAGVLVCVFGVSTGYLGRMFIVPPPDEKLRDAAMLNELSLLKNARLYRHVDDMEFLQQLDTSELFADD